jgi:hypothetical protein
MLTLVFVEKYFAVVASNCDYTVFDQCDIALGRRAAARVEGKVI